MKEQERNLFELKTLIGLIAGNFYDPNKTTPILSGPQQVVSGIHGFCHQVSSQTSRATSYSQGIITGKNIVCKGVTCVSVLCQPNLQCMDLKNLLENLLSAV